MSMNQSELIILTEVKKRVTKLQQSRFMSAHRPPWINGSDGLWLNERDIVVSLLREYRKEFLPDPCIGWNKYDFQYRAIQQQTFSEVIHMLETDETSRTPVEIVYNYRGDISAYIEMTTHDAAHLVMTMVYTILTDDILCLLFV